MEGLKEVKQFYEMKDKNRTDEWDDGKSRLYGVLKYFPKRTMKNDKESKHFYRKENIEKLKIGEEFVTKFNVDGKYKECQVAPKFLLDYGHNKDQMLLAKLSKYQPKLRHLSPAKAEKLTKKLGQLANKRANKMNEIDKLKKKIARYQAYNKKVDDYCDKVQPKIDLEFWTRHTEQKIQKAARDLTRKSMSDFFNAGDILMP